MTVSQYKLYPCTVSKILNINTVDGCVSQTNLSSPFLDPGASSKQCPGCIMACTNIVGHLVSFPFSCSCLKISFFSLLLFKQWSGDFQNSFVVSNHTLPLVQYKIGLAFASTQDEEKLVCLLKFLSQLITLIGMGLNEKGEWLSQDTVASPFTTTSMMHAIPH